ncbi:hypothetical protein FC959_16980 [Clostridium botulinum]|nr:hypothetical protein [Clostridium botulinum]
MKFKVEIEETVTYRHTVTVEANHEEDVDYAVDCFIENADCKEDIYGYMKDNNVKVIDFCEDGSPDGEFECEDIEVVDEYEEEKDE